jgi:3',5'-cyclic AMP phosphodiesterase CpdA
MPLTLGPMTRRRFLHAIGAGAGLTIVRPLAARDADVNRLALMSDTHVPESPAIRDRGCNMTDRLRAAVRGIVELKPRPAGAFVAGDLAWKTGTSLDYALLAREIEPIRQASIPLHFALGNHDTRNQFLAGLKSFAPDRRPVDGKHVLVVELPRADVIVLDSLEPLLGSAGKCGPAQYAWLAAALDRTRDKPAIIVVHHNPVWDNQPKSVGLTDTAGLWDVIAARPRVKALVFGHTHTWKLDRRDGIHLINLPAVAYPFAETEPTGWVDAGLREAGVSLTLRAFDPRHAAHGQLHELTWR